MGASQSDFLEDSVHDFVVKDKKGQDFNLNMYKDKDKVLLIVNVASNCGFTDSNYKQLTDLHTKYKSKGLEILAFPCNQFLNQEPLSSEEVEQFACTRFQAEFPILHKVRVNGPSAAPIFKFLKEKKPGFLGSRIKWNFTKFLVDKEGHVIGRYSPKASPSMEKDIEKAREST